MQTSSDRLTIQNIVHEIGIEVMCKQNRVTKGLSELEVRELRKISFLNLSYMPLVAVAEDASDGNPIFRLKNPTFIDTGRDVQAKEPILKSMHVSGHDYLWKADL